MLFLFGYTTTTIKPRQRCWSEAYSKRGESFSSGSESYCVLTRVKNVSALIISNRLKFSPEAISRGTMVPVICKAARKDIRQVKKHCKKNLHLFEKINWKELRVKSDLTKMADIVQVGQSHLL
ncbi:MAG: hypothetical protein ACXWV8_10685 [Chitinophagaceae bacterium]